MRNARLDRACEAIAEIRASRNQGILDERGEKQGAMTEMVRKGLTAYRHAGVELLFADGQPTLSVRLTKKGDGAVTVEAGEVGDGDDEELDTEGFGAEEEDGGDGVDDGDAVDDDTEDAE